MGRRIVGNKQGLAVFGTLQTDVIEIGEGGVIGQIKEGLNTKTGATGTVAHDLDEGAIWYHSSVSANFTANFTNVDETDNRVTVVTLVIQQGGTGYYSNAMQINGAGQTIRWLGNSTPTPTSSSGALDIVTFNMIRTGSSWYVTGLLQAYA